MASNKESTNFGDKMGNFLKNVRNSVAGLTNINLGENLSKITVKISDKQKSLLEEQGNIYQAIGTKLVVVGNDDGCMLFRLTDENGIEKIDLGNVGFKIKNIARVFKRLFVIEGDNKIEVIKFNPNTGERGRSLGTFKRYQKGRKDPRDRSISGVTFFTSEGHSQTEYSNDHGGDIPNFKLVSKK